MTTFVAKDWKTIASEVLSWIDSNTDVATTDLRVGSLERSHVEALALALEELYYRVGKAIPEAISESCYHAFGFDLLPGVQAAGSATFYSMSPAMGDVLIPHGTLLLTKTGVAYLTSADCTLALGQSSVVVGILARETGTASNVPLSAVNTIPYAIVGVDSVENTSPTSGGKDLEADDARALRFSRYVTTLPRGTATALEFAALSVAPVASARVVEPFGLPVVPAGCPYAGLVWLWVDTGSTTLDAGVKGLIDGAVANWKASGVQVLVKAVTQIPIRISASIRVDEGAKARFWTQIKPLLDSAATQYFAALPIGARVSFNSLLVALANADTSIREVNLSIGSTSAAVPVAPSQQDIVLQVDSSPLSTGYRGSLVTGTFPDGTFPAWSLL